MRGNWIERIGWELAGVTGLDGRGLTLRELAWAAREKRRHEGELAAWHLSGLIAHMPFTAREYQPAAINPYRVAKPKSKALAELEAWQREANWRLRAGLPLEPLKVEGTNDGTREG